MHKDEFKQYISKKNKSHFLLKFWHHNCTFLMSYMFLKHLITLLQLHCIFHRAKSPFSFLHISGQPAHSDRQLLEQIWICQGSWQWIPNRYQWSSARRKPQRSQYILDLELKAGNWSIFLLIYRQWNRTSNDEY